MKLKIGGTTYEWTKHGWQWSTTDGTLVRDVSLLLDEVVRLREENARLRTELVARLRAELGLDSVE